MSPVRRGVKSDASAIAQRVADQLFRDAQIEPLVSAQFSRAEFEYALASSQSPLWVEDSHGRIRGHLYGATFDDALQGRQTWTGPDGYSFEFENVLDNLLEWAEHEWREQGSTAHLVWALAGSGTQVWVERRYLIVSVRGSCTLDEVGPVTWPAGHRLRRAGPEDIDTAVTFDGHIDAAQGIEPSTLSDEQRAANLADLQDLLDDPECRYYLLEIDGHPAAQCVTFRLPALRGNFEDTVYLGSLAVDPAYRRRGLARRLVRSVLDDARRDGYGHAEVRWHIDNLDATPLWAALGFRPTYVQLRRELVAPS